ncbi:MAG: DUF4270 domain-containing protein [Bacteroidetes bacterium]|nr:DUF4270 domain-containing protein [Bacteroidota bacterium]
MTKFFRKPMIKIKNRLIQLFCINALIISGIFVSCEKEPDSLGFGILPGEENINAKFESDSNIVATTIKLDSILSFYPDSLFGYESSFNRLKIRNILGDYLDPFWGRTQSSMLINFIPDSADHNFGTNPVVDSLVLFLEYDSVYGDKTTNMELTISELSQGLDFRKTYFSNINAASYKGNVVANSNIQFKDSLLKIKINGPSSVALISKLLNVPTENQSTIYQFQQHITGLWIDVKSLSTPGVWCMLIPCYTVLTPK